MRYAKLYDAMLATPIQPYDIARGEITWALLRGACYSAVLIVIMAAMGLVQSWWMLLALPATMLIGFGFGGAVRLRRGIDDLCDDPTMLADLAIPRAPWRRCPLPT